MYMTLRKFYFTISKLVSVLFSFRAVIEMERGLSPEEAARVAMAPIIQFYPSFSGALVAVNTSGNHGMYFI